MKKLLLFLLAFLTMAIETQADDMTTTPLTMEAVEAGTVNVANPQALTIEYSVNGGAWTASNADPVSIDVEAADVVQFRGDNPYTYSEEVYDGLRFTCTNDCYVYGNVMSLLSKDGFATATEMNAPYGLGYLFTADDWGNNTTIRNHPTKDIVLPATTVADYGYLFMFYGCEGLTRAPELPATTLGDYCYDDMFSGCTNMTQGPSTLPATTLSEGCYTFMFAGSGLVTPPTLPATTLANMCYDGIFMDCASLATAPELPATTLVSGCYSEMFMGCTSLTEGPVLPAETLEEYCYLWMFNGCSSLRGVTCLATDISAEGCTMEWMDGVAATGTFTKAAAMDGWTTDDTSGIPEGWTVADYGGAGEVTYPVTISASTYATLYYENTALMIPEGVTAYTAVKGDNVVTLTELEGVIPAGCPVVIHGAEGDYYFRATTADAFEGRNDLIGSEEEGTYAEEGYKYYVLCYKNKNKLPEEVGFYYQSGSKGAYAKVKAHQAYMKVSKANSSDNGYIFDTGEATGITNTNNTNITNDAGAWYSIDGRRLATKPTTKGVYIHNGRKVVMK